MSRRLGRPCDRRLVAKFAFVHACEGSDRASTGATSTRLLPGFNARGRISAARETWTPKDPARHDILGPRSRPPFPPATRLVSAALLAGSNVLTSHDPSYMRVLQRLTGRLKPVRWLPVGNNVGAVHWEVDRLEARRKLKIDLNATWLGFFGQLDPTRGVEDLMDAVELLRRQRDVRLLMIGSAGQPRRCFGRLPRGDSLTSRPVGHRGRCRMDGLPRRRGGRTQPARDGSVRFPLPTEQHWPLRARRSSRDRRPDRSRRDSQTRGAFA